MSIHDHHGAPSPRRRRYVVAYLDRTNIGLAQLDMGGALGIGAGLFFIGYCHFEIPSNDAMKAAGARLRVTRIMVTWGLVTVATAFVTLTTALGREWTPHGIRPASSTATRWPASRR